MSLSALQKFFLPPVIVSAAVFSVMTVPLALLGSQQMVIKIEEEPVFFGKLRDIATPYVVFATALSLGAGVSMAAFAGWRRSARQSTQYQEQLSQLEENLQQKEELLKEFKLSESRLQIAGLGGFLDDKASLQPESSTNILPKTITQPVVVQTPPVHSSKIPIVTPRPVANPASAFASAQNFVAYTQTNTLSNKTKQVNQTVTNSEIEQLQQQLREMMLQMQAMQSNLQQMPQPTNTQVKASEKFQIYYQTPNANDVRF